MHLVSHGLRLGKAVAVRLLDRVGAGRVTRLLLHQLHALGRRIVSARRPSHLLVLLLRGKEGTLRRLVWVRHVGVVGHVLVGLGRGLHGRELCGALVEEHVVDAVRRDV